MINRLGLAVPIEHKCTLYTSVRYGKLYCTYYVIAYTDQFFIGITTTVLHALKGMKNLNIYACNCVLNYLVDMIYAKIDWSKNDNNKSQWGEICSINF